MCFIAAKVSPNLTALDYIDYVLLTELKKKNGSPDFQLLGNISFGIMFSLLRAFCLHGRLTMTNVAGTGWSA